MAPEIIDGIKYDGHKADIFSFGVLIFTLVMGMYPFLKDEDESYGKYYKMIKKGKVKEYWEYYQNKYHGGELSSEFKDLII